MSPSGEGFRVPVWMTEPSAAKLQHEETPRLHLRVLIEIVGLTRQGLESIGLHEKILLSDQAKEVLCDDQPTPAYIDTGTVPRRTTSTPRRTEREHRANRNDARASRSRRLQSSTHRLFCHHADDKTMSFGGQDDGQRATRLGNDRSESNLSARCVSDVLRIWHSRYARGTP